MSVHSELHTNQQLPANPGEPGLAGLKEAVEGLVAWLDATPSDEKAVRILRALAQETRKRAAAQATPGFDAEEIAAVVAPDVKDPKDWLDWTSVETWFKARRPEYEAFVKARGGTLAAIPRQNRSRGGRGNKTQYFYALAAIGPGGQAEERAQQAEDCARPPRVRYRRTSMGEVQAVYPLRWLFQNGELRMRSPRGWFLVACICLCILATAVFAGLAPLALNSNAATALSFVVFAAAIWYAFVQPWMRLFDRRMAVSEVVGPAWGDPVQVEVFRDDAGYKYLRLVRITGNCGVCGSKVEVRNGGRQFGERLVGRCDESPAEHVFSFDRVTMVGMPLHETYKERVVDGQVKA